jgi:hypothetical protein
VLSAVVWVMGDRLARRPSVVRALATAFALAGVAFAAAGERWAALAMAGLAVEGLLAARSTSG